MHEFNLHFSREWVFGFVQKIKSAGLNGICKISEPCFAVGICPLVNIAGFADIFDRIFEFFVIILIGFNAFGVGEFNQKFGTKISGNEKILDLSNDNDNNTANKPNQKLTNKELVYISKIKFGRLQQLYLGKNNISDISPFKNCNFPKLKKLSLESDKLANPQDKITDISPLMHTKFPELFILNLKNNLIRDISYLLFMNFPNLIILDLSYNLIDSVYVFSEVNFPNLETLDLSNNLITDISPFISSNKRKQSLKNVENSNNTLINSSGISEFLSKSISNNESTKKNSILPSLKILKIKNNKLAIDEGYLMTIKALKNRDVTIYK